MSRIRLFWDFFGPSATRTAEHFRKHLDEFLLANSVADCETGTSSSGPGHDAAYCVAPLETSEGLQRALRPRRSEPEP
jgi:uncharacterized protein